MSEALTAAIHAAVDSRDLTTTEMQAAVGSIMDGEATESQIAALLTALRMKGETVAEIAGAARAMIDRCATVPCKRTGLLDTCGAGGDGLHTFNISTAAAFVAAACGVPVAKHGNRSVSSTSGSADVLEALGVNIHLSPQHVADCIEQVGIGFCFAPLAHQAMKHAVPVRRQLGFRTIFNLLGPLTNPAGADFQLLGTGRMALAEKLAGALAQLGRKRAIVVCGNDELDEVSLWGATDVWIVEADAIRRDRWTAADFGLAQCGPNDLTVTSSEESAAIIRGIFANQPGPAKDIVVANAAAALLAAGNQADPKAAAANAATAIADGRVQNIVQRLVEFSQSVA